MKVVENRYLVELFHGAEVKDIVRLVFVATVYSVAPETDLQSNTRKSKTIGEIFRRLEHAFGFRACRRTVEVM